MRSIFIGLLSAIVSGAIADPSPFGPSSQVAWTALSLAVQGRNHVSYPWEAACFPNAPANLTKYGLATCQDVQNNYLNRTFRSTQPSQYMFSQWETCQTTRAQCMLDYTNPTNFAPLSSVCAQGSVPSAYIDARGYTDIVAALLFSEVTGVPIVVKNTGHDFKGRSSAPGSLSIWTRNMNNISYSETFTPAKCSVAPQKAVTVGAGTEWQQVYDFSDQHNFTVLGGSDPVVGAAGGWLQGGGHGFLSPSLGLGVDRVLQIKVVTADGKYHTANSCQNTDLFWALRGGGGGTFGVVTEATYLVAERKPVQAFVISSQRDPVFFKQVWTTYIANAEQWAQEGWGGRVTADLVLLLNQAINSTEAVASMTPFTDLLANSNATILAQFQGEMPSWTTAYNTFIRPNAYPIGYSFAISSRLVPVDNFRGADSQAALLNAFLAAENNTPGLEIYAVTPYAAPYNASSVSAQPAWRNSIIHVISGSRWMWNATATDIQNGYKLARSSADNLRAITPTAAYQNEADTYESDYTTSFWGSNYPRLLAIKQKYDPNNTFTCHQCVGWNPSDTRYKCYI